ncbi:MAG: glycosyltransferase family 39 protein [Anaerolineales bacterium]|nr:glycosyltransferase family 39 protein [Anaerolineales bacterium]
MNFSVRINQTTFLGLAVLIFLLAFALTVTSLDTLGPTFDEQGFLVRGLGYLREGNHHMRVGHPLGLNALNAVLLVGDESVRLPIDDSSWQLSSFHRPAELFLWEIGNNVSHVMFLGRLPTIWLGLLLLALAARWARQLAGRKAALLTLALLALDPNILAHTRLTTTDLGLAAGVLVAGYTLWCYWQRPSPSRAVLSGIGFALLQNTKFTAGLFVPLFAIVIVIAAWRYWRTTTDKAAAIRQVGLFVVLFPLSALLALWAMYGFQIGTLPDNLPILSQLGGMTLPLSHHLEQLLDIGGRLQKATPAFLLGQYSDSGWWYYFPVTFVLKTPLPTLLLLGLAFGVYLRFAIDDLRFKRHSPLTTHHLPLFLLVPALGYFAFALTTDINLGYRHLLPILPLLAVFTAVTLSHSPFTTHHSSFIILPAMLWLAAVTLTISPNFLAFFNVLAGGPNNGWRALVDSNLDWGQDLPNLADWMTENDVDHVWLSYFGEARPEYYGIEYTGLDSFPPRLMNPQARPFFPANPAPGIYAISATNLQGVHFTDHDQFAYFRNRDPIAKIGYSIFIYEVTAVGPPLNLALGGLQPDEIALNDYALLGTNDVSMHWFDPAQSLLLPAGESTWLALAGETAVPIPNLPTPVLTATNYVLYHMPPLPETAVAQAAFTHNEGQVLLLDVEGVPETAVATNTLQLTTHWLKNAPPQPIKIFIHLTDAAGSIVAQWDGLGAPWQGWRAEDHLWQTHTLALPADMAPGSYQLWIGLYDPDTGTRWQLASAADRYLLDTLEIQP